MRTFVDLSWMAVAMFAFYAMAKALDDFGASHDIAAALSVFLFGLVWATWRVYHKRP